MKFETAILIREKTRLERLIERFNSKSQAAFYLSRLGEDFSFYEREHASFYQVLNKVERKINQFLKCKIIQRTFLPTYIFSEKELVFVLGQDGLVANTAKYVHGLPIIGINPDQNTYDGVLLNFLPGDLDTLFANIMKNRIKLKPVTMAEAKMNDGQTLLAFNDFYIGANSHVSSKYRIDFKGEKENQSSSGIIVSAGAGSTGWLSSVYNMHQEHCKPFECTTKKLVFVVREPFLSKTTQIGQNHGIITQQSKFKVTSNMPMNGVIFSDGIEADFLQFNSGSTVEIGIAKQQANLAYK